MKRWWPTREQLRQSRWLAPVAHHLDDDRLWHLERGSVARAVAIGLFVGLLLPVAQFVFAVVCAIWLRGHVAIAAGATLVTNPFTFAPLYWLAYQVGGFVLGADTDAAAVAAAAAAKAAAVPQHWWTDLWVTVQNAGAPLAVGLAVLAVTSAAVGFCAVWVLWRPRRPHA